VRGNVDPVALFAGKDFITDTIHDTIKKAGTRNHIMVGWGGVGWGAGGARPASHVAAVSHSTPVIW